MFFPIGTDRPQRRFPLMNIALIAANVIVFLSGQVLAGAAHDHQRVASIPRDWYRFMLDPSGAGGGGVYDPTGPHLYQFITYQFLHADLAHIGFNMLFLYVFGNNLNEKLGHLPYLIFYLAGGVLAGCGHVLTSAAPCLGASGAISAVTGLFLVLLPRIHIKMFIWLFVYIDVWEIPSMYFILFKFGQDVFEQSQGGSSVAYMAHISGTVAGFLIGILLLATRLVQRDHYDLLAMLNRYRRRQEYRSIVAQGYNPFDPTVSGPVSANTPSRKPASAPAALDPRLQSLRDEISRLIRLHQIPDATRRYLELKALDPAQVLPQDEQLDVANQLMSEQLYAPAAAAYEDYLRTYTRAGGGAQPEQITLILGLIYSRYLPRPERARELFRAVLPRLHQESERQMALAELQHLDALSPSPPAT